MQTIQKIKLSGSAIILILALFISTEISGQEKSKSHGPPSWAPAHGYRANTRHVYFPEHNFYFDLQKSVYIYVSSDTWQVSVDLPSIYAKIDLSGAFKVELELDTDLPQKYNADHKAKHKIKAKDSQGKADSKKNKAGKGKGKK